MENLNSQQKLLLKLMVWSGIPAIIGLGLASLYINPPHTQFQAFLGEIGAFVASIGGLIAGVSFIAFIVILIGIAIKEGKN